MSAAVDARFERHDAILTGLARGLGGERQAARRRLSESNGEIADDIGKPRGERSNGKHRCQND